MNQLWHETHPMPRAATMEQRLAWHVQHEENCGCRPIPDGIRALINDEALKQQKAAQLSKM